MTLTPQHAGQLARFRVPPAMLQAAGVRSVSNSEARDMLGLNGDFPGADLAGIFFPYLSPQTGVRVGARLRLDSPLSCDRGGKYLSECGCRHVFFAPTRADALEDTSIPVVIVEAEKSALALAALAERIGREWLVVALGGCWGWRRKIGKRLTPDGETEPESGPSPDFNSIRWQCRTVIVSFDANTASNPEVRKALKAFNRELTSRGCDVRLTTLPQREGVNGPDDFLAIYGDDAMLKVIDASPASEIEIRAGELPAATDAAEDALVANAERFELFQRSGELMRVITLPELRVSHGLKRPAGTVQLEPLSRDALKETLERIAKFVRFSGDGKPTAIDCPSQVPAYYLARKQWRLPILTGVIGAPILRGDGSVLCRAGYDEQTGLYLRSLLDWPEVPDAPTQHDAARALVSLCAPFSQVPFVSEGSRAVHLAAIVTAIQRRLLPACPLFAFSAPVMRSGKSLLAESVGIIAAGKRPPATTASREPEELRKSTTAALYEGHAIVNFDNVEHPLQSEDLARALTQTEYQDRILGETRHLRLPTNVTWLATGNNIAVRGDLTSRTLLCRIDAECEHPEERTFAIPDLPAYLLEHRADLVTAALTVVRAYHIAGRPKQALKPWGGFEDWSDLVRSALVWAGADDPCATRDLVAADDSETTEAASVLSVLHTTFDGPFTVHEVIARATSRLEPELADAVALVAEDGGKLSPRLFGWWCRKWRDRVVGGLRLQKKDARNGAKWSVEVLE